MPARRLVPAAAIVCAALVAAGCGPAVGGGGMESGVSSSPGSAAPTPPGASASGTVTVDGVAARGALPSCTVLTATDGRHFVLLGAPDTPLGVPVAVTGNADPTAASYCNAGTPVQVTDVHRR